MSSSLSQLTGVASPTVPNIAVDWAMPETSTPMATDEPMYRRPSQTAQLPVVGASIDTANAIGRSIGTVPQPVAQPQPMIEVQWDEPTTKLGLSWDAFKAAFNND